MNISTLDVLASVKNISPIANIAVNAAITPSSSLVDWRLESTAIARVGKRHAMTVATAEVNCNIRASEYTVSPVLFADDAFSSTVSLEIFL